MKSPKSHPRSFNNFFTSCLYSNRFASFVPEPATWAAHTLLPIGWYEAGWEPMMSEVAFFVKDVVGPKGCVSIVAEKAAAEGQSANVDAHTQTQALRLHHSTLGPDGKFTKPDEIMRLDDEPDHDGLCHREQEYFLATIRDDLDLGAHMDDALASMRIVAAADESFRTGRTVDL